MKKRLFATFAALSALVLALLLLAGGGPAAQDAKKEEPKAKGEKEEEPKTEIEKLIKKYKDEIKLDTSKGFAVKNLKLERETFSTTFEDGYFIFTPKMADKAYAGVFFGKGTMTIKIPEPVKDMMWKNVLWEENREASSKGVTNQPFTEAFLGLTPADYDYLTGKHALGQEITVSEIAEGELPKDAVTRAKTIFGSFSGFVVSAESFAHAALNDRPYTTFLFLAKTRDFQWTGYFINPDLEREIGAFRGSVAYESGRYVVTGGGQIMFDKAEDYKKYTPFVKTGQTSKNWVDNLRYRLHEDKSDYHIKHYDMDMTIEKDNFMMRNTAKFTFRPLRGGLRCPLFALTSHTTDRSRKSFHVRKLVDAEGKELEFYHDNGTLLVDFKTPLPRDRDTTITLDYTGQFLVAYENIIRPDDIDPTDWQKVLKDIFDFLPTGPAIFRFHQGGALYPMAASSNMQESTYEIKARTPEPYIPTGSGATIRRWEENGFNGLHAKLDKPVGFYGLIMGAYEWDTDMLYDETKSDEKALAEKWGNVKVNVYSLEKQRNARPQILEKTRSVIDFYNDYFQISYRYDEMNYAQMPFFLGFAQAPPGFVQMTGEAWIPPVTLMKVLPGGSRVPTGIQDHLVAHELGHQWWPDIIGMRNYEQDAWLSEGFAEYSAALYTEALETARKNSVEAGFRHLAERYIKDDWFSPRRGILAYKHYEQSSLYSEIGLSQRYSKGPLVLHMLRQILGPELFRTTMRRFIHDFAGKRPVTPDFIDTVRLGIAERVQNEEPFKSLRAANTPHDKWPKEALAEFRRLGAFYPNLDEWFRHWYIEAGHAKIRFSYDVKTNPKTGKLEFTGRIEQDPKEFKMVLAPITLVFGKGQSYQQIFVDKPDFSITFPVPQAPTEVRFDEFNTLAAEVSVSKGVVAESASLSSAADASGKGRY